MAPLPKSKMLSSVSETPFRLLPRGRGGLVYIHHPSATTRPSDPDDKLYLPHLGLYNARNSVGVFFTLSEQSCFCAHIDARVRDRGTGLLRYQLAHPDEGKQIQKQVVEVLEGVCMDMGYNVRNTGVTRPYTKRSLLMTSLGLNGLSKGKETAGMYVMRAVWQRLQLTQENYPLDEQSQGFVMEFPDNLMRINDGPAKAEGGKPGALELYEEREEFGREIHDFNFEIEGEAMGDGFGEEAMLQFDGKTGSETKEKSEREKGTEEKGVFVQGWVPGRQWQLEQELKGEFKDELVDAQAVS